ncbi:MAG: hypothetical protein CSA35_06705 [Dethiosulfovibrio peptidovorans]|nr:MAG: hypothetical protein CSA35_06705 [Dethiosulfovibrio peptidovorans]
MNTGNKSISFQVVLVLMFFLLTTPFVRAFANEASYEIPKDADVTSADQALVKALGPGRGAVEIIADIRDIEGVVGGVQSIVVDAN